MEEGLKACMTDISEKNNMFWFNIFKFEAVIFSPPFLFLVIFCNFAA
jgi:hypothetical protein